MIILVVCLISERDIFKSPKLLFSFTTYLIISNLMKPNHHFYKYTYQSLFLSFHVSFFASLAFQNLLLINKIAVLNQAAIYYQSSVIILIFSRKQSDYSSLALIQM